MNRDVPPGNPSAIELPLAFNHCRHGHEIRRLSTHRAANGWLLWGHYACRACPKVALDLVHSPPSEALIAGRQLPVEMTARMAEGA